MAVQTKLTKVNRSASLQARSPFKLMNLENGISSNKEIFQIHSMWWKYSSDRRAVTYSTPTALWHQTFRRFVGTVLYLISLWCSLFPGVKKRSNFFFFGVLAFPQPSSSTSLSAFSHFPQCLRRNPREQTWTISCRLQCVGGQSDAERQIERGVVRAERSESCHLLKTNLFHLWGCRKLQLFCFSDGFFTLLNVAVNVRQTLTHWGTDGTMLPKVPTKAFLHIYLSGFIFFPEKCQMSHPVLRVCTFIYQAKEKFGWQAPPNLKNGTEVPDVSRLELCLAETFLKTLVVVWNRFFHSSPPPNCAMIPHGLMACLALSTFKCLNQIQQFDWIHTEHI